MHSRERNLFSFQHLSTANHQLWNLHWQQRYWMLILLSRSIHVRHTTHNFRVPWHIAWIPCDQFAQPKCIFCLSRQNKENINENSPALCNCVILDLWNLQVMVHHSRVSESLFCMSVKRRSKHIALRSFSFSIAIEELFSLAQRHAKAFMRIDGHTMQAGFLLFHLVSHFPDISHPTQSINSHQWSIRRWESIVIEDYRYSPSYKEGTWFSIDCDSICFWLCAPHFDMP